jgi:hypothetical protein
VGDEGVTDVDERDRRARAHLFSGVAALIIIGGLAFAVFALLLAFRAVSGA